MCPSGGLRRVRISAHLEKVRVLLQELTPTWRKWIDAKEAAFKTQALPLKECEAVIDCRAEEQASNRAGSSPAVGANSFYTFRKKKMTPESALELIPVLQAVADRKEVEYSDQGGQEWHRLVPKFLEEFIAAGYKFRVKPKPEIIPFDYSDDLVGMVVATKHLQLKNLIVAQSERGVSLVVGINTSDGFFTYEELLSEKVFPDGSPCGKEVAE